MSFFIPGEADAGAVVCGRGRDAEGASVFADEAARIWWLRQFSSDLLRLSRPNHLVQETHMDEQEGLNHSVGEYKYRGGHLEVPASRDALGISRNVRKTVLHRRARPR